jgi:hypothetical protein
VHGRFNANLFFRWLGGAARGVSGQRIDWATVHLIGAKREQASEIELQRVIDSAARIIDWGRDGKVYLITETVLADSIHIVLSTSIAFAAEDSVTSDSTSARGDAVRWAPHSSTQLALRFPRPYRVLYNAEQLGRRAGPEHDPTARLVRVPIVSPLR